MLSMAVQDFLAEQYAVSNSIDAEFAAMRAMQYWMILCFDNDLDMVTGRKIGMWDNYHAGGGGGRTGGIRIGAKDNTVAEKAKIKNDLEKDTDSKITVDDNGIITDIERNKNSDGKYDDSFCRLTEMKKLAEERGIYLTIGFFDNADLTDGNAFYPNGINGKSEGPTVGISREQYSSNLNKPSIYNYLYEESLLGISSTKVGEFTYNLSRVIGHEFFGHAYLYISGQNRFNESFAVEWENIVGALFGDPFRICYDCRFIRNGVFDLKLPDY